MAVAALLAGCGSPEAGASPGPGGPTGPGGATGPGGPTGPSGATGPGAAWLAPHDQVRAGTFPGVTVSPAPSPALPTLAWSAAAAGVAQAWASGCTWGHNPVRDPDGVARGENIAASTGALGATAAVAMWAAEWSDYAYPANTCAAGKVCGHYTQLVWRATLRVGCATATCTTGSPFGSGSWTYVVCDYEPPGNVARQRPY